MRLPLYVIINKTNIHHAFIQKLFILKNLKSKKYGLCREKQVAPHEPVYQPDEGIMR